MIVNGSHLISSISALRKFHLTPKEEDDIKFCNESARPYLISFSGHISRSQTRRDLFSINNGTQVLVLRDQQAQSYFNVSDPGVAYSTLAKMSSFSAVGRGDNLFSYRFSEVMACGSIPVVYADDWMLPFGDALINWSDVAVVIREAETINTVSIISNISLEDRCKRRQRALHIYKRYIETGTGTIQGIIETLERSAEHNRILKN
jgi:Exostosin family